MENTKFMSFYMKNMYQKVQRKKMAEKALNFWVQFNFFFIISFSCFIFFAPQNQQIYCLLLGVIIKRKFAQ